MKFNKNVHRIKCFLLSFNLSFPLLACTTDTYCKVVCGYACPGQHVNEFLETFLVFSSNDTVDQRRTNKMENDFFVRERKKPTF